MSQPLTDEYRRAVIDAVQKKINDWIGRSMQIHEVLWLKQMNYPYKIHVDHPIFSVIDIFKQEICYLDLMPLVKIGEFDKDVEALWQDVLHNYFRNCYGG